MKRVSRRMLLVPVVLIGVLIFVALVKTKQQPQRLEGTEIARAVRVIPAPEVDVVPRAVGYGNVQPAQVWEAVAEVSGKVVAVHTSLDAGAILPAGAELLRIDPTSYRLARQRAEADVQSALARLRELDQKKRNTERQLTVESEALTISRAELERKRRLLESGTISRSEFDREERAWLSQRNAVQTYQSTLDLIPAERQRLRATLDSARARLEDARRDVEHTVIRAPFECRIATVNVEKTQYVSPGQVMVVADSIGASEVPAQVPLAAFLRLLSPGKAPLVPLKQVDMDDIRRAIGVDATVRLDLPGGAVAWDARLSRLSDTIDPQTRTVGVIVVVDNPYVQARPGERPPLVKNMYCEVELRGKPRGKRVVVPRSAVREGRVNVVDAENRLRFRPVRVDMVQGDVAALLEGVAPGEQVVITDLVPAVEGMLLDPRVDDEALSRVRAEATGAGAVR
ncbi:efflux RND transporter periplasmic adaptor subunit [Desulfobaculum sp.]